MWGQACGEGLRQGQGGPPRPLLQPSIPVLWACFQSLAWTSGFARAWIMPYRSRAGPCESTRGVNRIHVGGSAHVYLTSDTPALCLTYHKCSNCSPNSTCLTAHRGCLQLPASRPSFFPPGEPFQASPPPPLAQLTERPLDLLVRDDASERADPSGRPPRIMPRPVQPRMPTAQGAAAWLMELRGSA